MNFDKSCNKNQSRMKINYFLLLLRISSCTPSPRQKESSNSPSNKFTPLDPKSGYNTTLLKNKILSIWTDDNSENAIFKIAYDSIFYVEDSQSFKYSLYSDSIEIEYPDYKYKSKIEFNGDTLVLSSENDISKFWKFEN